MSKAEISISKVSLFVRWLIFDAQFAAYVLWCICTFLQKSTIISNNKKNNIFSPLFFSFVRLQTTYPLSMICSLYSSHPIFYYHLALRVMGAAGAYPGCPQVRWRRIERQNTVSTRTHTYGWYSKVHNSTGMHFIVLWEEAGVPGENHNQFWVW